MPITCKQLQLISLIYDNRQGVVSWITVTATIVIPFNIELPHCHYTSQAIMLVLKFIDT